MKKTYQTMTNVTKRVNREIDQVACGAICSAVGYCPAVADRIDKALQERFEGQEEDRLELAMKDRFRQKEVLQEKLDEHEPDDEWWNQEPTTEQLEEANNE